MKPGTEVLVSGYHFLARRFAFRRAPRGRVDAVPVGAVRTSREVDMALVDGERIAISAGGEERTPFHAVVRVDGASAWIELIGEFDLAAAPTLDAVVDSLEGLEKPALCVDLGQVTLIDAGGL